MATEWNINSDIYDIVNSVKNVQKRYIEDEEETTLSLGIFGFIVDTESKKIQTSTIMAGQLGNEMFPTRANLTKNILTHAAYNGITDIAAIPATITITLCVKSEDIDKYINDDNLFYLESNCPIFIGNYEFHFDYDIKIYRKTTPTGYSYSAQYVIKDENGKNITNRLTNINNPYLKQPFVLNIGNKEYIGIQAVIRQFTIEDTYDTMRSDSIVENKTYNFNYTNQLADFIVYVTENNETVEVTPYLYGSTIDPDAERYCWYLYNSDNSIRIVFDSTSYVPGLSADIHIKAFTTLGAGGNFNYLNIDDTSEGLYVELTSTKYKYKSIMTYLVAVTDSANGSDIKSKDELKKLIPKAAMSRGSITTETDINNYFNLINTEDNKLLMRKKLDNQVARTWYGFFLLKDFNNNIIPSNTISFNIDTADSANIVSCGNNKYLIPAGTVIRYNANTKVGDIVDDSVVPDLYSKEYFGPSFYYYMTIYDTIITKNPLHAQYHLTIFNYDSYYTYDYVNDDSNIQFIANRFHFERNLLTDQGFYNIGFNISQSIADSGFNIIESETIIVTDPDGTKREETIIRENLKIIMVLYKEGVPYRWKECTLDEDLSFTDKAVYHYGISLETDNVYDNEGNIKIVNMCPPKSTVELYGYLPENTECKIFILANIPHDPTIEYPRMGIDDIATGYEDMVITNIYSAVNGLKFFENYTGITDTFIANIDEDPNRFLLKDVPVVGRHYMYSDTEVKYLMDAIEDKKAYIDYCLDLVENSINVDFKFFNTYGPSRTYYLEDQTTKIGNIDVYMKFKLSLKEGSDGNIKNDIIRDIKLSIENLENIKDWHAPNLITDIINKYDSQINFLEFVGFNTFGADDQHIIRVDELVDTDIPEFINVRNTFDPETNELIPMIEIELV